MGISSLEGVLRHKGRGKLQHEFRVPISKNFARFSTQLCKFVSNKFCDETLFPPSVYAVLSVRQGAERNF